MKVGDLNLLELFLARISHLPVTRNFIRTGEIASKKD
jgi:hypothetical protein